MKSNKITSIGEALVDWVCLDRTLDLNKAKDFVKAFGGAPANLAVALAKLDYPVQFLGGFSGDAFGRWIKEYLASYGVDLSISLDIPDSNTRNAYVLTNPNGERVLKGFTLSNCADSLLYIDKINLDAIKTSPIVYFGSLLQADVNCRETIRQIVSSIGKDSIKVYDPNLRLCLWPSTETAISVIKETIQSVDILKLSDDEICLVSPCEDIEVAARSIFNEYNLKLLVVTLGCNGSFYINKSGSGFVKPFCVETVELTGAGDGFVAGLLGGLYDYFLKESPNLTNLNNILENISCQKLEEIMQRANAIGALTTTKPGATLALPTRMELDNFLSCQC